jgi:predicted MPP superfamily phosphohydrolase
VRNFYPLIVGVIVILIFGFLDILFLRHLNRVWWRHGKVRLLGYSLPLVGVIMVTLWGIGDFLAKDWLAIPGSVLTAAVFVIEAALMLSLPISGVVHFINWLIDKYVRHRRGTEELHIDTRRRLILKSVAAAIPIGTLAMGTDGLVESFVPAQVRLKTFHFPNLAADLDGLRVMDISDIHLRHYVTLSDLEKVVEAARAFSPDLVLIVGDIADDLKQLGPALRMLDSLRPRHGIYASLGNHEYYRGIGAVRAIFERSPVPLLVNQGLRIPVGASSFYLAAIDDPVHLGTIDPSFFQKCIDIALTGIGAEDFVLLMSHRPWAFEPAVARGIDLTIAGHTHGGQIGLFGRSLFEEIGREKYFWGHYQIGEKQLYTSSGAGHWFPFRLGCPTEAPVIELRKGESSARTAA